MANDLTLAFLDSNVLAKPVTRTLLILGADASGFAVTWSTYVEVEAERHLPERALPIKELRRRYDRVIGPGGTDPSRFAATSAEDRQVLADADAVGALYIVTENVQDFAHEDLASLRMTAAHPDLFMTLRFTGPAYEYALALMVANMNNPPRTAGEMHALIARQHPRLAAAHADAFGVGLVDSVHRESSALVRGVRCLVCESAVEASRDLVHGLCPGCQP